MSGLGELYPRLRRGIGRRLRHDTVRHPFASMRRGVRRRRLRLRVLRRLVEKEAEWRAPLSLRRPRWWRKGFLSRSAVLYDLDHNDPENYISDLQRYFSTKRMVHPRLQDVINNKLTTHLLLRAMDIPSTELLGVYWRGAVHRFPDEERQPLADFLRALEGGRRVFFKPLTGAEGKRLFSVRRLEDGFRMNGQEVDHRVVRAEIERDKRPMVVEEGIEQHDAQRQLFPETTNTIRLLTMLDMTDRQPFIVVGVQRIGTQQSGFIDNWTQGGLSARIDLDTGRLGAATRLPDDSQLVWYDAHPDTSAPIKGVEVPFWPEIRETILHAARVLSFMEYIGWDIVVTPNGPVVLEANINTGMNVLQVHQPLLEDPRARAYFVKRGVVRS